MVPTLQVSNWYVTLCALPSLMTFVQRQPEADFPSKVLLPFLALTVNAPVAKGAGADDVLVLSVPAWVVPIKRSMGKAAPFVPAVQKVISPSIGFTTMCTDDNEPIVSLFFKCAGAASWFYTGQP